MFNISDIGFTEKIIRSSLNMLIERDCYLIEKNLKEECINHQFASYLAKCIEESGGGCFDVDIEYNKCLDDEKTMNDKPIRPDILVHCRGKNGSGYNYLAIECKKKSICLHDKEKIKYLLDPLHNYNFGCFVLYLPTYIRYKIVTKESNFAETMRNNCTKIIRKDGETH